MNDLVVTEEMICAFSDHLRLEEKSSSTIEKYIRDIKAFRLYSGGRSLTKELVIEYKEKMLLHGYAVRSINSMIASLNSFFCLCGLCVLPHQNHQGTAADVLLGGKGTDQGGIYPSCEYGGAQRQPTAQYDLTNHLRHGNPCE